MESSGKGKILGLDEGKSLGLDGKSLELGAKKLGSLAVTGENKVQRRANEQKQRLFTET